MEFGSNGQVRGQEFDRNFMIPRRREDFQSPEGAHNRDGNSTAFPQSFHNPQPTGYEEKFYGYAQPNNAYGNSTLRPYGNFREGMSTPRYDGGGSGYPVTHGAIFGVTQPNFNSNSPNYNQSYNSPSYSPATSSVDHPPSTYNNKSKYRNTGTNDSGLSKYGGNNTNSSGANTGKRTFNTSFKNYAAHKAETSYLANLDTTLPADLRGLFEPLNCKLCSAQLTSTVMAKVHYASNAHEKRLRKWLVEYSERTGEPLHKRATAQPKNKEEEATDPKYFHCQICDIPLTGRLHAESHYMGRSHNSVLMGRTAPPQKKAKDFGVGGPEGGVLSCEICSVCVTSSQQLEAHMTGQKHIKKVKALSEIEGEVPCPVVEPEDPNKLPTNFGLYCTVCALTFNSKIQFQQHMLSKKHLKKVAAKENPEAQATS